jgi:hypothetical protein
MPENSLTYKAKLVAELEDYAGYINYVFERLEYENLDEKYIMCVRFPNWSQATMKLGDVGFVTVRYVYEGESKWWDGTNFNTYNYTNIVFLKFIHEKKQVDDEIILD